MEMLPIFYRSASTKLLEREEETLYSSLLGVSILYVIAMITGLSALVVSVAMGDAPKAVLGLVFVFIAQLWLMAASIMTHKLDLIKETLRVRARKVEPEEGGEA